MVPFNFIFEKNLWRQQATRELRQKVSNLRQFYAVLEYMMDGGTNEVKSDGRVAIVSVCTETTALVVVAQSNDNTL